ncbi:hypothetical protein TGP89_245540 [Toxoplasma gondii p89]|uniref:Uncharacterized protein n=2 Tax=Toxoplasma gondii TaxID=5811 RepID=A0A086JP17_TOXGO|nr:hypothetical protein TGFOU_245540 [Toxoplasma gondii FOU]KFG47629.1 hypothetical protein TGP89_245540 [Toxoplasma gondii p89]
MSFSHVSSRPANANYVQQGRCRFGYARNNRNFLYGSGHETGTTAANERGCRCRETSSSSIHIRLPAGLPGRMDKTRLSRFSSTEIMSASQVCKEQYWTLILAATFTKSGINSRPLRKCSEYLPDMLPNASRFNGQATSGHANAKVHPRFVERDYFDCAPLALSGH